MRSLIKTLVIALGGIAVTAITTVDAHTPETGLSPAVNMPEPYRTIVVPDAIWTDERLIARGRVIYVDKCGVCHGAEGRGDGPAAAGLRLKPP